MVSSFIYNSNETMKILGEQCGIQYIGGGAVGCTDFMNTIEAHKEHHTQDIFSIGIDFFNLGVIYGKKAERAERNGKDIKPLTDKAAMTVQEKNEIIYADLASDTSLEVLARALQAEGKKLTPQHIKFLAALVTQLTK